MPIEIPPPIFDHPYMGEIVEWRWPPDQIEEVCGAGASACSYPTFAPGVCVINIPTHIAPRTYALLRLHEIAHCNGWRH